MKPVICPCCKYQPRLTPKGNIYKGSVPFEEVSVSIPKHESYDSHHAVVGLCCPKCGVIFKEVKP